MDINSCVCGGGAKKEKAVADFDRVELGIDFCGKIEYTRMCLKIAFREMCFTFAEMNFQTRSSGITNRDSGMQDTDMRLCRPEEAYGRKEEEGT